MQKIRYGFMVLGMLLCLATPSNAELSIGFSSPNVSIGINLPLYPELVVMPDYPVYYAPRVDANYFFYDGMYWVFQYDNWYASDWYDGPWWMVEPDYVPLFILRIPVSYYRHPPAYFRGWPSHEPPRWGRHWGHDWERRRGSWDRWDRHSAPQPAPRPDYQRQYKGDRYPRGERQQDLRHQQYRYQPRDTNVRDRIRPRVERRDSNSHSPQQRGSSGQEPQRGSSGHEQQRGSSNYDQQRGPSGHEQQRGSSSYDQSPQRGSSQHEPSGSRSQPQPQPQPQERGGSQGNGHGQEREHGRD